MNVTLPNGNTIEDVPDNVTQGEVARLAIKNGLAKAEDFKGILSPSELAGQSPESFSALPKNGDSGIMTGAQREFLNSFADPASYMAFMTGTISALNDAGDRLRTLLHIGGGDDKQMAQVEQRVASAREEHPIAVGAGEFVGESVPNVVGWDAGASLVPEFGATTKLGKAASIVAKNIAGSVGSQLAEGNTPTLGQTVEDATMGSIIHGGIHAAGGGIRKLGKNATKAEIEAAESAVKAENAEAERITSQLSPEALGYVLAHSGDERNELIKQLAEQTGQNLEELKAAIKSIGEGGDSRLVDLAKEGLRGDFDKLAQEAKTNEERMQIAREIGLNPEAMPLSFFSDNQQFIEFYQALKQVVGSKLSPIETEAIRQTAEAADRLIKKHGGNIDLSQLDQSVRGEYSSIIEALQTQSDALYETALSAIPSNAEAPATTALEAVKEELEYLGGNAGQLSPASKDILQHLTPKRLPDGTIKYPTFGSLETLRQDIGEAIEKQSGPYRNAKLGKLRQLYGALTEDSERALKGLGQHKDIKLAKSLVEKRKNLEKASLKLFGRDVANSILPNLKGAVASATKGDASKMRRLMLAVPESMRKDVAVSALHYLFTSGSRGADQALSISQFVKNYEGLMRNSAARDALFQYLPAEAKADLAKFYTFARGANTAIQAVPKTGVVGTISQEFKAADTMAEKILTGDIGKKAAVIDKVIGHIPGVAGAYKAAKGITKAGLRETVGIAPEERMAKGIDMLSSPEFGDLARHYANRKIASEAAINQAEESLKRSRKYQSWYSTLSKGEQAMINAIGPYRTFAFWATLRAAENTISDDQQEE